MPSHGMFFIYFRVLSGLLCPGDCCVLIIGLYNCRDSLLASKQTLFLSLFFKTEVGALQEDGDGRRGRNDKI